MISAMIICYNIPKFELIALTIEVGLILYT